MEDLSTEDIRKTFQSLADITLCAICLETVRPDMVQCLNGHLLCADCKQDLEECPTCRGEFSHNKPSGIIIQFVSALPPRCKHKNCGRYLKKSGDDHEKFCGFSPTTCKLEGCEWKGPSQEIIQHVRSHAGVEVYSGNYSGILLRDFDPDQMKNIFIPFFFEGQFFWNEVINDTEKKNLVIRTHFVPNGKPTFDFFMKISLGSKNYRLSSKIKLNLDTGISNEEVNFFIIPKFMLSHFLDEDRHLCGDLVLKAKSIIDSKV